MNFHPLPRHISRIPVIVRLIAVYAAQRMQLVTTSGSFHFAIAISG